MGWVVLFPLFLFSLCLGNEVDENIYTSLNKASPCVRLLNINGTVGCSTPTSDTVGTLRIVSTQNDFNSFLSNFPSYRVALVLPFALFNRANLANLSTLDMAGVLLRYTTPPSAWSPEAKSPNAFYRLDPSQPPFDWNPTGEEITMDRYHFAISQMTQDEDRLVSTKALWNENEIAGGNFPSYSAIFNFRMFAQSSSVDCLGNARCIPVGGYSIWSTFGVANSTAREVVMAVATMDSNAMFHDLATGANADQSGVVAVVAAASALSNIRNVANLPRQLMFALFNGETYGFVGSRKFVADILGTTPACNSPQRDASGQWCKTPYHPNLAYRNISIDRIAAIVEMNQLTKNTSLFVHRQHDANPATDALVQTIRSVAPQVPIEVGTAATDTPGIPPSSLMAFVRARPSIAGVVITDHYREYANPFYHSEFDNEAVDSQQLCQAATLLARTLWLEAGGSNTTVETISADCGFVHELYRCFVQEPACELTKLLGVSMGDSKPPSHYSGVFLAQPPLNIGGYPKFLYQLMDMISTNASASSGLVEQSLPGSAASGPSSSLSAPKAVQTLLSPLLSDVAMDSPAAGDGYFSHHPFSASPDSDRPVYHSSREGALHTLLTESVVEHDLTLPAFELADNRESPEISQPQRLLPLAFNPYQNNSATSFVYFHDAVDPALNFSDTTGRWDINVSFSSSLVWTESNWSGYLGVKIFRSENPTAELALLLAGVGVFVLTSFIVWRLKPICQRKFKSI